MKSFIPWIGGKTFLARKITECFPDKIGRYVEVFGGGGSVLFAADSHAPMEVYNDINGDLVNLFRCLKYHKDELIRQIEGDLISRETFENYKNFLKCDGFTDIQRAAMFYYILRVSFGANCAAYGPQNKSISTARFDDISRRLERVNIENRDFEDLIKQYDKKSALFYCDPPYHCSEKRYAAKFDECDHLRLRNCLENISGKFVITYNDDDFIRDLYSDFSISPLIRSGRFTNDLCREILIKNF